MSLTSLRSITVLHCARTGIFKALSIICRGKSRAHECHVAVFFVFALLKSSFQSQRDMFCFPFGTAADIHLHQLCLLCLFFSVMKVNLKHIFEVKLLDHSTTSTVQSVFILVYFRRRCIMENPLFGFCSLCYAAGPFVTAV